MARLRAPQLSPLPEQLPAQQTWRASLTLTMRVLGLSSKEQGPDTEPLHPPQMSNSSLPSCLVCPEHPDSSERTNHSLFLPDHRGTRRISLTFLPRGA